MCRDWWPYDRVKISTVYGIKSNRRRLVQGAPKQILDGGAFRRGQKLTKHTLGRCTRSQHRRQPKIANLDDALAAVNEYVVGLEVAVDDGRSVAVQIDEPAQNLPGPPLEDLRIDVLVPLAVPAAPAPSSVPNQHQPPVPKQPKGDGGRRLTGAASPT